MFPARLHTTGLLQVVRSRNWAKRTGHTRLLVWPPWSAHGLPAVSRASKWPHYVTLATPSNPLATPSMHPVTRKRLYDRCHGNRALMSSRQKIWLLNHNATLEQCQSTGLVIRLSFINTIISYGWLVWCNDGWIDGWMCKWIGGLMAGWMDG